MLSPYATKPSANAAGTSDQRATRYPMQSPVIRDPAPEKSPFKRTISIGSLSESFRVQLFSSPQHTAASRTSREPFEKCMPCKFSRESSAHAAVTQRIPSHSRTRMRSRKTTHAISAVATISKLFRSAAQTSDKPAPQCRARSWQRCTAALPASVWIPAPPFFGFGG